MTVDQTEYQSRLLKAVPDEAIRLFSRGWVSMAVRAEGPALAWTTWDKRARRFEICFMQGLLDECDDETLGVLMRHELGHIALGHFQTPQCGTDVLIATDISINWYLRKHKNVINSLGGVDAEEWLEKLELAQQPYPVSILHDILHEKMGADGSGNSDGIGGEEGFANGQCGGIESTNDARAVGASIMTDKALQKDGEFSGEFAKGIGSHEGGLLGLPYTDNLPAWLGAMEEFARSTVRIVLSERRSHKRPQPALVGAGVHVPTERPQWAPEPDSVCFLVDTSGSMWDDLKYVQPVLEYLRRNQIEVRMIAGDVKVTFDEVITEVPKDIGGGGGTEIVPLFTRARKYEPRSMVVFSDAYISQIPPDPAVPVLWVGAQTGVPAWATKA